MGVPLKTQERRKDKEKYNGGVEKKIIRWIWRKKKIRKKEKESWDFGEVKGAGTSREKAKKKGKKRKIRKRGELAS